MKNKNHVKYSKNTSGNGATHFLDGFYDDVLQAMLRTKYYLTHQGAVDRRKLSPEQKMHYSLEMSRITVRLTSTMAWLLGQRAVAAGEITPQDAMDQHRLEHQEICMEENEEGRAMLPIAMRELVDESLTLYQRAHRLDMQATTLVPMAVVE